MPVLSSGNDARSPADPRMMAAPITSAPPVHGGAVPVVAPSSSSLLAAPQRAVLPNHVPSPSLSPQTSVRDDDASDASGNGDVAAVPVPAPATASLSAPSTSGGGSPPPGPAWGVPARSLKGARAT